jgi:hypothetical protein
MRMGMQSRLSGKLPWGKQWLTAALIVVFLMLSGSQHANAIPAFARKYGLRCSACHESWPMLNYFGQKFKDNGYQLMNDRDAPIWQNPGYWPITFRMTPMWHRFSTGKVAVDQGDGVTRVTSSGFDLTGLDFHTGGTLEKNFSFYLLPSSDENGNFHFETVMARFDNLMGSPWLNIKVGKFELDNLLSEKRILTLTGNGGIYQLYHFIPVGDGNIFGQIGDNQLGVEVMGHSYDDRTRYSASLLSSSDGSPGLIYGANSYSGFFTASQAFDAGRMGVDRIGGYVMIGQAPTTWLTSGGPNGPLPGSGVGNKSFSREGFVGQFYFGQHFDLQVVTQHGSDNAWFGQGYGDLVDNLNGLNNAPGGTLPAGAQAPSWNGVLFEPHYVASPQLIFIGRYETIRMSKQSNGAGCDVSLACTGGTGPGASASNLGNISTYTIGYRYNPFMTSRAGFAFHNEYNWLHQDGTSPSGTNLNTSELMFGFDFDF